MTYPHQDPEAEAAALAEAERKGDGRGCGGCHYLGWGPEDPGLARCCHPERSCFTSRTLFAFGCSQRVNLVGPWPGGNPGPGKVLLGPHAERLHQERLAARKAAA